MDLTQSTAFNRLIFMVDDTTHISGAAGLSLTITAGKAGAAFASISPTVTDLGNGWYSLALTTTHTDTLGCLGFHITATGADPLDFADLVTVNGFAQGVAFADFQFRMTDAAGTGITGLVNGDFSKKEFSIGGGAQGSLAGTITEDPGGEGFYLVSFAAAELAGRSVAVTFEATGAIPTQLTIITNP